MQKIIRLALMLLLLAALALANTRLSEQTAESVQSSTKADEKERKVVIDAGHGGKDPGKVAEGGILEKDLNLQIAKKTGEELQKTGVQVIYTRTEDEELGEGEEGGRKLADMEARTELINRTRPDLTVSIHQNSYPDSRYRGAQVFYSNEALSLYFANAFMYLCKEWLREGCRHTPQEFAAYSSGLLLHGLRDYLGKEM